MTTEQELEQFNLSKLAIITLIGVLILGGAVYAAYRYSQKQSGNIILPGGVTYIGPSPKETAESQDKPQTAPLRFTTDPDVEWEVRSGRIYPYSFSYPKTLPLVVFIDDPTDSVAISWGNIPPQQNILLNLEFIDERDPSYLDKPKIQYVREWHKFFSGLKGTAKIERFTNTNGLKGYKASYINTANVSPNVDVFFEVPGEPNLMIRMANGILDPKIFDRIIDSLKWTSKTSSPTSSQPSPTSAQ